MPAQQGHRIVVGRRSTTTRNPLLPRLHSIRGTEHGSHVRIVSRDHVVTVGADRNLTHRARQRSRNVGQHLRATGGIRRGRAGQHATASALPARDHACSFRRARHPVPTRLSRRRGCTHQLGIDFLCGDRGLGLARSRDPRPDNEYSRTRPAGSPAAMTTEPSAVRVRCAGVPSVSAVARCDRA